MDSIKRDSLTLRPSSVVKQARRDTALDPKFFEIEITESAAIGNDSVEIDTLNRSRGWGIQLALDDFGTGCSSLSDGVELPITTLEIEQSFVRTIGIAQQANAITWAVLAMAQNLSLLLTATRKGCSSRIRRYPVPAL